MRRSSRAFSLAEMLATVVLIGILSAITFGSMRSDDTGAQRSEAFASLTRLLRVEDSQMFAAGAIAGTATITTIDPELAVTSEPSTAPDIVSVQVTGSTLLAAARFGDQGCVLLRREYAPTAGVDPVVWAIADTAAICAASGAADLVVIGDRGLRADRPVIL